MFKPFAILCAVVVLASPATGQSTTILSPCQDGLNGGASQTEAEMAKLLQGTWRMSAAGTGYTLGTNVMPVPLKYDAKSGQLKMGTPGQQVTLTPVRFKVDKNGKQTDNTPFKMSIQALSPGNLSETDLATLGACTKPARYFWRMERGGQKSWGALMFVTKDIATGFMANSAGGSRKVVMTR